MDDGETSPEDERQQLFEYAALGREVESFWASHVGKYLLLRADSEFVKAMEGLETVDVTNVKELVRLQGEAWRAKSFRSWMSEAIKTGLLAENQLENRDGN